MYCLFDNNTLYKIALYNYSIKSISVQSTLIIIPVNVATKWRGNDEMTVEVGCVDIGMGNKTD